MNYQIYLKRCFDLARLGNMSTSPNPSVGSVIVSQNRIIGEGWHQRYGKAHAEVNAVLSVDEKNESKLPESTILVSLEPCFHFGKTPPCVDLILKEKISNTVIAFSDPNPKVAGKSIEKLRLNDVSVTLNPRNELLYNQCFKTTLKPFFTNISQQRPYIILKWAESADNFIGLNHHRVHISNQYSQRLVHKWRAESDGILIGTQTALVDNPSLTNRLYYGKSPVRIIIDKSAKLPHTLNIFNDGQPTRIYTEGVAQKHSETVEYIHLDFNNDTLPALLSDLMLHKINILFVEGGAHTLQKFIDNGLWDEARVLKNPNLYLGNQKGAIPAPILSKYVLKRRETLVDNELLLYENH